MEVGMWHSKNVDLALGTTTENEESAIDVRVRRWYGDSEY
jgi:hypothetical protein